MGTTLIGGVMTRHLQSDQTDDELMASWRRGDAVAFDTLYSRYRERLWGYLFNNTRDEALATEMFQDVWLRVISAASGFRHRGRFRSWLFTLAHHRLEDHYRRHEQPGDMDEAELPDDRTLPMEHHVEQDRQLARMSALVAQLPFEQRQAFYLREECGFSVREIADIQQASLEATKSRLRYAYAKLREALGETK